MIYFYIYCSFSRFSKDDKAKDKRVASLEPETGEKNKRIEEIFKFRNSI